MNWTFKSAPLPKGTLDEFIREYAGVAAEAIESWIFTGVEFPEKQPESDFAEWPEGFLRDEVAEPFAYRYELTVGFYHKGKYYRMGPVPYNITIERATPADYAGELNVPGPETWKRVRYIDSIPAIT